MQRRYNRFNVEYSFYLVIIFFPLKIPKIKTGFFFQKMCISRLWNNWRYTSSILHILVLLRVIEEIILKTIKKQNWYFLSYSFWYKFEPPNICTKIDNYYIFRCRFITITNSGGHLCDLTKEIKNIRKFVEIIFKF